MQPKLRFKGFTNNWNKKPLSSIFNKIKNAYVGTVKKYYTNEKYGHFYLESNNIKNGKINKDSQVFVNNYFYNKQRKNWLHTGDIVMVQSGAVGDSAVIDKDMDNTAAHAIIIISNSKYKIDSYFFNDAFQSEYFKREIYKIAIGNTIVHILSSDIKRTPVNVPNIKEQRLIGRFFAKLDKLISLQQAKCSLLKKQKQGYLQELFPQKDKSVPRVRFNGFNNGWSIKHVGELMKVSSSKRIHRNEWTKKGIPFLRARDIVAKLKDTVIDDPIFINFNTYQKYSKISGIPKIGDLLVTGVGTIGKPLLVTNSKPFYFKDGNIIWFHNNNVLNKYFFYYYFNTSNLKRFIKSRTGVGTVATYTIKSGRETPIKFPSLSEQRLIGNFFKQVDNNINLQQNKLNYLRKLKKAYLQKMFC